MSRLSLILLFAIIFYHSPHLSGSERFTLSSKGESSPVIVADNDWKGVIRAARDLADDIGKVSGKKSEVIITEKLKPGSIVAGTIGSSKLIDSLISVGKLDVDSVKGKWESFVLDVVDDNLIIAGSDKRGTIYGIYEISRQIGVSPWYYWADIPVMQNEEIEYLQGRYIQPEPKVKYRGIFINDEWPSFGGWCVNQFGGINSKAYSHLFELLLRLKANYLWPAMWATAFNEDDEMCPKLADEYGIVMGTSHHEPMMRAHKEYTRRRESVGPWDYSVNAERLDQFFREGIERNKNYDNLITIGMRGDGDVAMGEGDDEANMTTLHNVIDSQRRIISDVYGRSDSVPQLWAIFTEVQRYYDAGFKVPDDVTLLFCDNNWGYLRRTAPEENRNRKGGFGLYYHIDMNGGPWNDRWINTSPLPKLREQLNLAYKSGLDRIWIINVGDLKPKEVPINFILDYAWDPDLIGPGDEKDWLLKFSASTFGKDIAGDVADILSKYPKYNLWRKPEVQTADIFSIDNYGEAFRVDSLWNNLAEKTKELGKRVDPSLWDAFYQLVYYPAISSAGVARMYIAADLNKHYALKGDRRANHYADLVKELFVADSLLTARYNDEISKGKWKGMMQDNHIGYTRWSMPERNIMPEVIYLDEKAESHLETRLLEENSNSSEYSIPAVKYNSIIPSNNVTWIKLPDLGREAGCMGSNNVVADSFDESEEKPALEYDILASGDSVRIAIGILPTQDINPERGLRIGVSLDNGTLNILDARRGLVDTFAEYTDENIKRSKKLKKLPQPGKMSLNGYGRAMRNEIFDNIRWLEVHLPLESGDRHRLRIEMIDPEIVVEKIVVNPDDSKYSYFGPPEIGI